MVTFEPVSRLNSEERGLNRNAKETTPFHRHNTHNQARIFNPFGNDLLMYIARRDFFLAWEASRVYTFLTIAVSDGIFSPAPGRNQ